MKYAYDGNNWLVRVEKGELLVENLTNLVKREHINGAWISGLGAAEWAKIGYYDLTGQQYHWKKFQELMEITSLQGNVAWDGDEPILHMHASFSDESFRSVGGHIKELQAGGTVEILLHKWDKGQLTRALDPDTGLKLLEV